MTPAAIISIIKDVAIVAVLGIAIYIFISYGKDIVKVADIKAVEKQLQANAETEATWKKEQNDADAKHSKDLADIAGAIGNQHSPVFVRGPASVCPVPSSPA